MGIRNYIKRTVKANLNLKGWSDWATVRSNGSYLSDLIGLIKRGGATPREVDASAPPVKDFEALVTKYKLTDKDLKKQMRSHLLLSVICAVLCVVALGWLGYLLMQSLYLSALVAFALSVLMGAYAVTENFYYYQIKQRTLTVTLKDWFHHFFK